MKQISPLTIATVLLLACGNACAADRVQTRSGVVEGRGARPSGVREFLGVPYAAPPVGGRRWAAPAPVKRWRGVRPASSFGPRCMQARPFSDMVFRSNGMSEDCLYLNIWTPATSRRERLPVMVYFYGGGFIAGDGSEPRYDGESMASRGIVAVTMSFRLGVFGFFSHPELTAESGHRASGDQGLLDQAAALGWVKRNIAAFGGDAKRVTIAGESAGSFSVSALMASPLTRTLFARAVGESGALFGGMFHVSTLAEAEARGSAFMGAAGARSLAELRAMPAEALLGLATQPGRFDVHPNVDGWFLPARLQDIYAAGKQAHAPLLAGSNNQEGSAEWVLGDGGPATISAYREALAKLYGDKAGIVFAGYPASADGQPVRDAAQRLASDRFIGLSTWRWMEAATRTGGEPTYYYLYVQPRPATTGEPPAPAQHGAVHSAEIEYALGNLDLNPVYAWTDADRATSKAVQGYFANFIRTGDPNGEGLPRWPRYATGWRMVLGPEPAAGPDVEIAGHEALNAVTP